MVFITESVKLMLFEITNVVDSIEYARSFFTEYRNSLGNTNRIKGLRMKKSLSDTAAGHNSRHTAGPIQVDAAGSAGTGAQVITR
jgi:hypothetical protein